jgi:hypothetical protein
MATLIWNSSSVARHFHDLVRRRAQHNRSSRAPPRPGEAEVVTAAVLAVLLGFLGLSV